MADNNNYKEFAEPQSEDEYPEILDEAAVAKEIQDDISERMQIHFSSLESDVRDVFSQRMESIESNLTNQLSERVLVAQSDILKTNKVFREICRPLGSRWKELFQLLTADLERSKVDAEMTSIQKHSSLMQPYKSLMSWKELMGSSFAIEELIPTLRSLGLDDLSERVDTILHHDTKEDLFDLSAIAKSIEEGTACGAPSRVRDTPPRVGRSSVPITRTRTTSSGSGDSSARASSSTQDQCLESSSPPFVPVLAAAANEPVRVEASLDDRHLLFLAKKIDNVWDKLARELKVPQVDVSDILNSEGSLNYQGAFRMLWIWREAESGRAAEESLDLLTCALRKIGRPDLIGLLRS